MRLIRARVFWNLFLGSEVNLGGNWVWVRVPGVGAGAKTAPPVISANLPHQVEGFRGLGAGFGRGLWVWVLFVVG